MRSYDVRKRVWERDKSSVLVLVDYRERAGGVGRGERTAGGFEFRFRKGGMACRGKSPSQAGHRRAL